MLIQEPEAACLTLLTQRAVKGSEPPKADAFSVRKFLSKSGISGIPDPRNDQTAGRDAVSCLNVCRVNKSPCNVAIKLTYVAVATKLW